jgi:hypothetical protein
MPANTNHKAFPQPLDSDVKVWRYMDIAKYVSMIASSGLFFVRTDLLGDPFEGSSTKEVVGARKELFGQADSFTGEAWSHTAKSLRGWTFASCWHMNEHESAAMWRLYSKSSDAIAVQATYARLVASLPAKVFVGSVRYIDYHTGTWPANNLYYALMHKRKSFEHEREVRAVIADASRPGLLGHLVTVNLGELLQAVYVAPTSAPWFSDLVLAVTQKYGGTWPIHRSDLDAEPIF